MTRKLFRLCTLLCITLATLIAPTAVLAETMRVRANTANIRLAPTLSASIVGIVQQGTLVEIIQWSGTSGSSWAYVAIPVRGIEGYLYGLLLESVPTPVAVAPVPTEVQVVAAVPPTNQVAAPAEVSSTDTNDAKPSVQQIPKATSTVPIKRHLGVGVQAGGFSLGFGVHARYWGDGRLGFELGLSLASAGGGGDVGYGIAISDHASVIQLSPSVVYRWEDSQQPKSVSVRPYVGAGVSMLKSSMDFGVTGGGETFSESGSSTDFGVQAFAGLEFRLARVPHLRLSVDVGYLSTAMPFVDVRVGGFAMRTSAHWYVR